MNGDWTTELLPEICALPARRPLPPEADLNDEYLQAVIRDGLLNGGEGSGRYWLEPPPDEPPFPADSMERREIARRSANTIPLRRIYSWAMPNQAALEALATLAPLIELGAGGGYWARLLRERGVDVAAYDRDPPPVEGRERGWATRLWSEVEQGSVEVLGHHRRRTLLLCWPSPGVDAECWAAQALPAYRGETVAFVGEGSGGCTGSQAFHDLLFNEFELNAEVSEVAIPGHARTHDRLWIYRR